MSLESVRAWLAAHAPDLRLIEVAESTATVAAAALALGVEPGRIAKTLAVRVGETVFLLVARGDARLDNGKSKAELGARPRMLGPEETLALTGHPVGGVCPFGLATPLPVYCDVSLRDFDIVYPAAGSLNSSVEVTPERLFDLVGERWIDLCRLPDLPSPYGRDWGWVGRRPPELRGAGRLGSHPPPALPLQGGEARPYARPMKRSLPLLLVPLLLTACAGDGVGPAAAVPAAAGWRSVATGFDRERARKWRSAWVRALARARAAGHSAEIAGEGPLLDPDAALAPVASPAGLYRCRVLKLGAKSEGLLDYVAYPAFDCRISGEGGAMEFVKLTGSQRPVGRLFADSDRRLVFLGTLQLGDEQGVLRYGHDRQRDMIGHLERIGERRWRLVFPYPAFESMLDVIELVPKE
jgi:prolyl-tRNA editing enzyme YbaK/EbsC (Cys-tRNA(Pro) deacylase)